MLELIPHRNEMLWIDKILSFGPEGGQCLSILSSKKHYISNEEFRSSGYVELMSQAFCLSMSAFFLNNKMSKTIKNPMLVGVDDFAVHELIPIIGSKIIINVKLNRKIEDVYFVQGKIVNEHHDIIYCEGGIRLYAQLKE